MKPHSKSTDIAGVGNIVGFGLHIALVSGRGCFEIVQKALAAGLPLRVSMSAPSSLAVRLARELGVTLVGFLRGQGFVIYSAEERILASELAPTQSCC